MSSTAQNESNHSKRSCRVSIKPKLPSICCFGGKSNPLKEQNSTIGFGMIHWHKFKHLTQIQAFASSLVKILGGKVTKMIPHIMSDKTKKVGIQTLSDSPRWIHWSNLAKNSPKGYSSKMSHPSANLVNPVSGEIPAKNASHHQRTIGVKLRILTDNNNIMTGFIQKSSQVSRDTETKAHNNSANFAANFNNKAGIQHWCCCCCLVESVLKDCHFHQTSSSLQIM